MLNRVVRGVALAALLVIAGLGQNLLAQSSLGGSINGTVTDPSGAAVAGASVQLTNEGTSVVTPTTTTSSGQFVFPVVSVGEYTITVAAAGFSQSVVKGISVVPNKTTTQNVVLKVGATTQTVEVTASAVHLETETAQQGTSFDQSTYADLPLALAGAPRAATAFSDLMPGVATAPTNSSSFSEPGEVEIFSQTVNGGQTLASEVYYDGVAMLQTNVAGDYRYQPVPVEAVSEFTLVQDNLSADIPDSRRHHFIKYALWDQQLAWRSLRIQREQCHECRRAVWAGCSDGASKRIWRQYRWPSAQG